MLEVPPKIWLYISSFIDNDELVELMGVNIHFYNLALDTRYRTIRVETVSASTDKLLHRLRDPVVASRAFRQFVASNPQPVSCTALSLQLTHEFDTTAAAAVEEILVNSVAPFINSLAPQLQALKIWSWSTLDLSALFINLGIFPQLREFHLRAPFNKAFPDATGLTKLLEDNSATLNTVELRLNPAGSAMDPSSEQQLGQWFASHESHPSVLVNLKTLRMYPTTLSSGFDALVMYTERSADSITTLAVKDRYLDLYEVEALIAPVAHRHADDGLQSLRLNVRVGGSHPRRAATELSFTGMHTHSFMSWKLRDIGVWQGGSEVPSGTMRLLADCIPSVQSFWGNGHMLGEGKIQGLKDLGTLASGSGFSDLLDKNMSTLDPDKSTLVKDHHTPVVNAVSNGPPAEL
ncbi:hypothetical protein DFH09DRAFT_1311239 [Mycena vulgaris]|nr:hypothetical protein DFH09DRAFT_1311239 [Mycena vulgaris]